MADFTKAHVATLEREGGHVYSNHRTDRGGETFAGISRKMWEHRTDALWAAIDGCRVYSDFPECLQRPAMQAKLAPLVEAFYRSEFWDFLGLDDVNDQKVAEEIYDTAINCGLATATRFAQRAVSACNFGTSVPNIEVDGRMGTKTLGAINAICAKADRRDLFHADLNIRQGHYYQEIVRNDPGQKANYNGWILKRFLADVK